MPLLERMWSAHLQRLVVTTLLDSHYWISTMVSVGLTAEVHKIDIGL